MWLKNVAQFFISLSSMFPYAVVFMNITIRVLKQFNLTNKTHYVISVVVKYEWSFFVCFIHVFKNYKNIYVLSTLGYIP